MADIADTLRARRAGRNPSAVLARTLLRRLITHAVLITGAAILMIPFFWMVTTSFKEPFEATLFPPRWLPSVWHPENYPKALALMHFPLQLRNTLIITVLAVTGTLLSSSLAGFAFGRLNWPLRDTLFVLVLGTMMLPGQVTIVPLFILFKNLGWIDTFLPLTVPAYLGGGAFNIFLTRQFVLTLPLELDDAARVDGASSFRIWWQIILPLTKPVLATIGIFAFFFNWHDFFGPLIFLNSGDLWTLELGLRAMSLTSMERQGMPLVAFQMAAATVVLIPPLLVFFLGQRFLIRGVVMSGLTA
jgi:ABC-type glycerol-3-phosphate transport system permease component